MEIIRSAQRAAGRALRARVAGDDAATAAERIWGSAGERRFVEADPVWRVHADASMFPGGVAALLLQSLHPQAMAGVAGHSGYRGDPWGRLQRTSRFIATTTFGTIQDSDAAVATVRAVHERVRGRDDRGQPYRASDPHLLRWVFTAEAHCFMTAYQRFGGEALTAGEMDRYVGQAAVIAVQLGADDVPRSLAELDSALQEYRAELRVTPAAREAARFLLLEPPLPLAAKPGYAAIALGGVALLPRWARRELGIPQPLGATAISAGIGTLATGTIRWAMAGVGDERQVRPA